MLAERDLLRQVARRERIWRWPECGRDIHEGPISVLLTQLVGSNACDRRANVHAASRAVLLSADAVTPRR